MHAQNYKLQSARATEYIVIVARAYLAVATARHTYSF